MAFYLLHNYMDFIIRHNSNNTIWLVLFFAWLSFGFTAMARKKDKEKSKNSNK